MVHLNAPFLIGRVKVRLGADAGEILVALNCGAVRVCSPSATSYAGRWNGTAATYAGGFGLQGQRGLAVRIDVLYDACRRSAGARVISRRCWLCRLRQPTPRSWPSSRGSSGREPRARLAGEEGQRRETGARNVLHGHCSARSDLTGIVQGTTLVY